MKGFQRLISGVLSFCLLISMLPTTVWASEMETEPLEAELIPEETVIVSSEECTVLEIENSIPTEAAEITKESYMSAKTVDDETNPVNISTEPSEDIVLDSATSNAVNSGTTNAVSGTWGTNLAWKLESGVLTISGYGPMDECWPESVPEWYYLEDQITTIVISEGVTAIGANVFSNCYYVTNVSIPVTVSEIGQNAFGGCVNLDEVNLPVHVTTIGVEAFSYCGLTNVVIPTEVTDIGYGAFYGCNELTRIKFTGDAPTIGDMAFYEVTATAYYPENNSTWTTSVMQDYDGDITWMPYIPGGSCGDNINWELDNQGILTISGTGSMGSNDGNYAPWYGYRDLITEVTIEYGVTSICDSAFHYCSNLTSVTIPNSVTSIGYGAFNHCGNLTSITIPYGVEYIGSNAFYYCISLASVTIPDSVISIGFGAFSNCSSLSIITIPNGITSIDDYAFYDCDNLTDVYYMGTEKEWNSIVVGANNDPLLHATVHYKGMEDDIEINENAAVRYFRKWDAEAQTAYWGEEPPLVEGLDLGSQVTEETDTSFLADVESLVGTYVLVETKARDDGMIAADFLLSIEPLVTKTGTVTEIGDTTITIDGITYSVPESAFPLLVEVGETVMYHLYEDELVGINGEGFGDAGSGDGSDDETDSVNGTVGYYRMWDAENQIAYFGAADILGSQITEETDLSFVVNPTQYLGQYVYVETSPRTDGESGADILIRVSPVDSKVGTVVSADASTIVMDGESYSTPENLASPENYIEQDVVCHFYNGKMVEIEILETMTGTLTYWDKEANSINIKLSENADVTLYRLSALADIDTTSFLGDTGSRNVTVQYLFDCNNIVYQMNEGGRCGDSLYWRLLEDGSILIISGSGDMYDFSEENLAPWYAQCETISSVNIIGDVRSIGSFALANLINLKHATINAPISDIGCAAFQNCTELRSINLSAELSLVEQYAFDGCESLVEAFYDGTSEQWNFVAVKDHNEELINILSFEKRYSVVLEDGTLEVTTTEATYTVIVAVDNNSIETALTNISCSINPGTSASIITGEKVQNCASLSPTSSVQFEWVIRIDRSAYAEGGVHNFTVVMTSNQEASVKVMGAVALGATNGQNNELDFDTDVWKFVNWSDKSGCEIQEEHLLTLLSDLAPSEKSVVISNLSEGAGGHCYGMAATVILDKMNAVDLSVFTGTEILRNAEKSKHSTHSILCYYWALQFLAGPQAHFQEFLALPSDQARLSLLAEKANSVKTGGCPVLFCFASEKAAHAVVAYALESGIFKSPVSSKTYNHRVLFYDSNAEKGDTVEWLECYNLLFNDESSESPWAWEIPAYIEDYGFWSANDKAYLMGCIYDLNTIDAKNYDASNYNYTATLSIQHSAEICLENVDTGEYWVINGTDGQTQGESLLTTYCTIAETADTYADLYVVLPDEKAEYRITTVSDNEEALDIGILFDDRYVAVSSTNAKDIQFSDVGKITLGGNKGDFEITIADDNVSAGEFNTYTVTGDTRGAVVVEIGEEGLSVSGNDLEGITIKASEGEIIDTTTIDDQVDIVEIGRNNDELNITTSIKKTVRIPQDYIVLHKNQTYQMQAEVQPVEWKEILTWSVEGGGNSIISISENGVVSALSEGTAYVLATISDGEATMTARCRVDVVEMDAEESEKMDVEGIQLGTTKLTSELYSTDYAELDILLMLPQNYPSGMFASQSAAMTQPGVENNGVAIETARFTDDALNNLFAISVLDDRRAQIVPTDYAVEHPKEVKSKYSGTITVTVQGEEYTSEELTLTVKKTQPKLKATIPTFNSFYSGQSQPITVTGGTVTAIYENASKNTAKTTAIPVWLMLEAGKLTLTEDAPLKNASSKVYILVETEEWRLPVALTLTVKNSYKAPGLKLSATSVTMAAQAENSNGVELKLKCKNKKDTLDALNVTGITTPEGYSISGFDVRDGSFLLTAQEGFRTGKIRLNVIFGNTEVTLPLSLTVKASAVSVKLSAKTVTLNTAGDQAQITLSASPADYFITAPAITGNEAGELAISYENGILTVGTNAKTISGKTYKLSVSTGGSKAATLTVKTTSVIPTVTLKVKGNLDLSFLEQPVTVTNAFKNYAGGAVESFTYNVIAPDKTTSDAFEVIRKNGVFMVRGTDAGIATGSYTLKLSMTLAGLEKPLECSVKFTVKRTAAKLKLSASKLTLNKSISDSGSVQVACTTKDYAFDVPVWQLMDKSGKNSAEGKLTIGYADGRLTVSINESTEYGATYKLQLKADAFAPSVMLTVSVPTEAKSMIKSSIKVKGSIDVIRDDSGVTLTPSYKNCTESAEREETLLIYSSCDGYTMPVNDLFDIHKTEQGTFEVSRTNGAVLDHSFQYKAKLVTVFGNATTVESPLVSIKVSMGKAKLTVNTDTSSLFAWDRHSQIKFRVASTDDALNEVSSIRIKEEKYRELFDVSFYGNNGFVIGFKSNEVDRSLMGISSSKAVTITLQINLDGNAGKTSNGEVKLKLNIIQAPLATSVSIMQQDLNVTSQTLCMDVGEQVMLSGISKPENAVDVFSWASSDPSVAVVDPFGGKISAKKEGIAVITCAAVDGSGKNASLTVKVEDTVLVGLAIKRTYCLGTVLTAESLDLKGVYQSGRQMPIYSGYTCVPATLEEPGTHEITVSYGGITETVSVEVLDFYEQSVEVESVSGEGYNEDDRVNWVLYITARYNGNYTEFAFQDDIPFLGYGSVDWPENWKDALNGRGFEWEYGCNDYGYGQYWGGHAFCLPDDPTLAGTYSATLSFGDATKTVSFTLSYNSNYTSGTGWEVSNISWQ